MILNESKEETIGMLESLQSICNAKADISVGKGKLLWAGYGKAVGDSIVMLKDREAVKPRILYTVERHCGYCDKNIEDEWITCPWCGRSISFRVGDEE